VVAEEGPQLSDGCVVVCEVSGALRVIHRRRLASRQFDVDLLSPG
jgi:hypothetical protein